MSKHQRLALRQSPTVRATLFSSKRPADDFLCLLDDRFEMVGAFQAFCVKLVNILRARRACRKPAAVRDHFQPTDRGVIARGFCEFCRDRLARQFGGRDGFRRQFFEQILLFGRSCRIYARVLGRAELRGKFLVMLAGILSGTSRDFGG
jgi:hypothetical protein